MINFFNCEILRVILSLHIHVGYLDWISVVGVHFILRYRALKINVDQNNVERRTFLSWEWITTPDNLWKILQAASKKRHESWKCSSTVWSLKCFNIRGDTTVSGQCWRRTTCTEFKFWLGNVLMYRFADFRVVMVVPEAMNNKGDLLGIIFIISGASIVQSLSFACAAIG